MNWLRKNVLPIILFIGIFLLYVHNLSRSVYAGDVGDFVTAAFVGGVPHPPGYPLFTLLGFLLTRINLHQSPAFMVGLISAFSGALGIVLFYYLIHFLTKKSMVAIIGSLTLAFSYFFWFYSEIAEVFALNSLFVISLLLLAILYRKTVNNKYLFASSFLFGLSLTNHQTIVFTIPSLFLLILPTLWKRFKQNKKKFFVSIIYCLIIFFVGFAIYIYVPIAASYHPIINWDHVHDFNSFFELLLRKDYGTFNAGLFNTPSALQRVVILKTYLFAIISQLTLPVIFLSFLGAFSLWKKDKILLFSLILGFLVSGPIFITYAGFPMYGSFFSGVYERFFLMSTIFILVLFPYGIIWVSELCSKIIGNKKWTFWFQGVFFIIPLMLFIYNFPKTNLSNVTIGNDLGYDLLNVLPKNSVLFLNGDTALFNVWYVHDVLKVRPDIRVININSLGGDEFFVQKMIEIKNKNSKNTNSENVIAVIQELRKDHQIFATEELSLPGKRDKITWIPYGLEFSLLEDGESNPDEENFISQANSVWQKIHVPLAKQKTKALGSFSISDIPNYYANALLIHANYILSQYKDGPEGLKWVQKAFDIDPNNAKADQVLGLYYLTYEKNCSNASKYLEESISNDPFEQTAYFLLYATEKDCLHNQNSAKKVTELFSKNLQLDFFDALNKTLKK